MLISFPSAKLDAETVQQREELIQLVFPYISCPLRVRLFLVFRMNLI